KLKVEKGNAHFRNWEVKTAARIGKPRLNANFGVIGKLKTRVRSLRSRDPSRWTFTVPKCLKQRLPLASLGSPKNARSLGPRSLRSRDSRSRTLTTAKSRQTPAPWAVHCFPRNSCAPPVAQAERGDNGRRSSENGGESAQAEPPAVQLLQYQHAPEHNCQNSAISAKTKDNVPNFLGFLVNY
ncbi:hypothetical protein TYRP_023196, partial [Tyrophagus putrescentiae]